MKNKFAIVKLLTMLMLLPAMLLSGCSMDKGGETKTDEPQATAAPEATLPPAEEPVLTDDDNYVNTAPLTNRASRAVDNLGRTLTTEAQTTPKREGKYIGLFTICE